ncbi:hypothetical protein D3C81_2038620 [compost metagenome]
MSAGIEEVTASVHVIADIAQSSGAAAQEVSSASASQLAAIADINAACASLSAVSDELQQVLGKFRVKG